MKFFASVLIAFCVLTAATPTFADVIPTDESQEPVSKKNVELPESSPSSPPLSTDDPGTPGPGGYEINFIGNINLFRGGRNLSGGVDANLGVGERLQLRVEKEARDEVQENSADFYAAGATDVGVKYRFFDNRSLKMAFYPSYNFDDGTRVPGADPEGRSFYLPIIISKALGRFTFLMNAGAAFNVDFANKKSQFLSVASGFAINDDLRVMAEFATQFDVDYRRSDVRIGAVKELFPNEASHYETGMFGSIGESVGPTEDGVPHLTLLFGFSLAKKPIGD